MENIRYITVMAPAASAGSIDFTLESLNASPNLLLNFTVTGIATSHTCEQIARSIYDQMNIAVTGASANLQTVTFPNQPYVAQYLTARTDHVVSITSQADFDLTLGTNNTGAAILIESDPTLATLSDVTLAGTQELTDCNTGTAYTQTQLISQISRASSYLAAYLNNNIVYTNYYFQDTGSGGGSIFVNKKPIVDFYNPSIRAAKYLKYPYGFPIAVVKDVFHLGNRNMGEVEFGRYEPLLDYPQPFDESNEIIMPYLAGYQHIPKIIKEVVAKWVYFLNTNGEMASQNVEGISEEYRSLPQVLQGYTPFLRRYKHTSMAD